MANGRFLNVDLEVESDDDLTALVGALTAGGGLQCIATHPRGRRFFASFELGDCPTTADRAIRRIARLVAKLPREVGVALHRARRLELNIGIQAGSDPRAFEIALSTPALAAAAAMGARIGVCVYAPESID